MFCLILNCFFCQRAIDLSYCLLNRSAASWDSLSGGGMTKQTPGTWASIPLELCTLHLVLPELSVSVHSLPFSITNWNEQQNVKQKPSHLQYLSQHWNFIGVIFIVNFFSTNQSVLDIEKFHGAIASQSFADESTEHFKYLHKKGILQNRFC